MIKVTEYNFEVELRISVKAENRDVAVAEFDMLVDYIKRLVEGVDAYNIEVLRGSE